MNGDGLLDRVEYIAGNSNSFGSGIGTVTIAYGYGPSLAQSPSVTVATTAELGVGASALYWSYGSSWYGLGEITDVDGDGYEDIFGRHELFGLPPSAAEAPPALLTRIDSGRDASTIIRYASRSDTSVVHCSTPATPFAPCGAIGMVPRRVVRDITLWSEGRNGPAVTSFDYEDPVVAPDELGRIAFRGFARVRVTAPSHGTSNGIERRAVTMTDYSYAADYRGQVTASRVFDELGRILRLDEHTYARLHVASSGGLPTYGPNIDRTWTCVPRTGSQTSQEDACRLDVGLATTHYWSAFAPYDISWYPWIEGEPGPNITLWRETTTTHAAIGSGAGAPTRRDDAAFGLIDDNAKYLVYPTATTVVEVSGSTSTQLAGEVIEYEQMPLALPFKTKMWLRGTEYATAMRRFHAATGVVLWEQKPEQYRRNPGATDEARIKRSYAYDPFFLYPNTTTNERGHSVIATRDLGTGVVTATEGPNSWVNPSCGTCAPVREKTRTDIDGFGRVIATWASQDSPTTGYDLRLASTTTYTDAVGTWPRVETRTYQVLGDASTAIRELTQVDATGLVIAGTRFATSTNGNPLDATTWFAYDAAGSVTDVTQPDPSNDTQYITYHSEADALGREVRSDQPDGASITKSYEGATITTQELGLAGDPNPGPLSTRIATHDAFGNLRTLTEVDDTLSAVTSYDYDRLGRLHQITDPSGLVTILAHDGGGRRTAITRGDRIWLYRYDDNGNQIAAEAPHLPSQDPSLYTTSRVYDDLDRPISRLANTRDLTNQERSNLGNGTTSWSYDAGANGIGRLRSTSTSAGVTSWITHTYAYDSLGNPKQEDLAFNVWNGWYADSRRILRQFDALGHIRNVTHADSVNGSAATNVAYDYDQRGLPTTARWLTAPTAPLDVATQTWNQAGALTRRFNNVSEQTWRYYRNGRVLGTYVQARPNASAPWTNVASQASKYFAAGDVKDMETTTEVPSAAASFLESWTFDYDDRHELTAVSGPSYEGVFTYTAAGRLQSVYVEGPPELDRDVDYDYTPASVGDPETLRSLQSPTYSISYVWDRSGNQTSKQRAGMYTWSYRYDGSDDLRDANGIVNSIAQRELYWYDAAGQRVLALTLDNAGQPSQLKLWFGESEIHYGPTGAVTDTLSYLAHGGDIGRIHDRSTIEFTFSNQLGHLLAVVESNGTASAGYTYSPFGELIRGVGSSAGDFRRRFNGKEDDATTRLQYYGARYYDDEAFLWTQADPLYTVVPDKAATSPRRGNRYTFSLNNPLRYVDTNGLDGSSDVRGSHFEKMGSFEEEVAAHERTLALWRENGSTCASSPTFCKFALATPFVLPFAVVLLPEAVGGVVVPDSVGSAGGIAGGLVVDHALGGHVVKQGEAVAKEFLSWAKDAIDRVIPDDEQVTVEQGPPEATYLDDKVWERQKAPTQVSPGTRRVTDQKPSSRKKGEVYVRTTYYDEYGRQIGQTHETDHGEPKVHPSPHYHIRNPITGQVSGPLPGRHPAD
jgi:RHS repeat-associated protein